MEYRRLGRSGIQVSAIALGSWLTYGTVTEQETAKACIREAFEQGINHFDCANVYGSEPHAAEQFLSDALAPYNRSEYVLTTKAFWPVGPKPNQGGLSRKHLMDQVDKSLKALKTDYVDIFYCHRADPNTEIEETLSAIDDLVRQGKVLYGGISEWQPAQITEALLVQQRLQLNPLRASQPVYNLLNRYIEAGVLPICEQAGIGLVVFSPLAQGLLTGKYKKGQPAPEGSRAANAKVSGSIARMLNDRNLERVDKLAAVAGDLGITLSQLALAWVLRHKAISSALIGASRPEQIRENVKAVEVSLSQEILDRIEAILA
ncbi:aldo/keto reductase family protein [Sulfobacillus harzensis]|uniref:Aldo/keto reductase n=1 Tax=Sulfobacillus harzensis TaxID=2729629 RepID=A0A7Y0L2Y4_9FIRM|nr:aldo/keto reductase family protein [Sulfobacillus harzensis]NMP22328.1 aldo/keto reductase [Sulfobacillus harzensis]